MKKLNLLFAALLVCAAQVLAEATFDFSTSLPQGWTATVSPRGYEDRGAQFIENSELSLPGVSEVKQVTILCSANEDNVNSIEVTVGGVSLGKKQLPKANDQTQTFESSTALEGELKILITRTKKSVWIKTVTIDGTFDSSVIPEVDLTEGLDGEYVYGEPTTVVSTDSLGSKIPYTFIYNNVKVIASMGTKTATYFGANAGSVITFVTTRKMKALVVDGFLRKGFGAESSAGKIVYKYSSDVDIEEDEVLAVTDIDTNIVSLTCDKQLRCHALRIYFEANPEVDIEPGEEGQFSYYYEPEETKAFVLKFDSLTYVDMTENLGYACTSLLFTSGEAELSLAVFASTIDGESILPVGTYPINDSYAANTVQASPGGDEYMDYPSYLATDFEQTEEGETYNPYYLVSGTVEVLQVEGGVYFGIDATSYNGSTIKGKYMCAKGEPIVEDAVERVSVSVKARKVLRDGRLMIERNGTMYNVGGQKQ